MDIKTEYGPFSLQVGISSCYSCSLPSPQVSTSPQLVCNSKVKGANLSERSLRNVRDVLAKSMTFCACKKPKGQVVSSMGVYV